MKSLKYLKRVLIGNAIFSGVCAIILFFFNEPLAILFNLPNPVILIGLGIGLMIFALIVWKSAQKVVLNTKAVKTIIILDFLWVIGSLVVIGFQLFSLEFIAYILIGSIALAVGDFGVLQLLFLIKTQKATRKVEQSSLP